MAQGTCSTEDCTGKARTRGLCDNCYRRWLRNGTTDYLNPRVDAECTDPDCAQPAEVRGLCDRHYQNWWRAQPPSADRARCSDEGCDRVATRRELCDPHYRRFMRTGETGASEIKQLQPYGAGCSVCGKVEQLRKGLCQKHYLRLKATGSTDDPQPKTHCDSGHEFTPENTYVHQGKRGCRECRKITKRDAYRRTVPVKCRACDTPARRHGLCQAHYDRQRFYGDALAGPPKQTAAKTAEEKAQRLRDASRRYRDSHLEQERERNRRYREENWLATRERHHRWLMANAERWYPELYAGREAPRPDPVDFEAILIEFGMVCHLCGVEIASPSDLDFDHVIPRARGGQHVYENIRPAHAVCNRRKGAKLLP